MLSAFRPAGMGLTPIPAEEIRMYMDVEEIEDRKAFYTGIRALDATWMRIKGEQMEEAKNGSGSN